MDQSKTPSKKRFFSRRKNIRELLAQTTQQMYVRNHELAETNQMLSLLRAIDKLVLESHDKLAVLCQAVAESVIEHSNLSGIAIMAIPARKNKLELLGLSSTFAALNNVKFEVVIGNDHSWIVGPELSQLVSLSDITNQQASDTLGIGPAKVANLREVPIKSVMFVKLLARHRIVGVMVVGFVEDIDKVSEKQRALVERLGEAVGIAIENNLLFEENQYVLRKLQKTNEKLKSLDETKDEFISMASHQLRTPLTSVKGYLSMVLEGDAGPITDNQKQLLGQAFTSSQRMVYLIADLLNVSRLKTGKFVIDASPTNLADVVEGEIAQLTEQAKGKNLKLLYEKPENFPEVMIDETKIRQVIMNFADNAVYYTPNGGEVKIELKSDKKYVYFMVKDNGLGVPKDEQRRLFGKFYRASNARKARPDGTGLGLFMAKKVVTAQGGNILFESQEGKGSTFGFSFDRNKLKPED